MLTIAAVLLVGGRSSRMGGGWKPLEPIAGTTMLARAIGAAQRIGCAPIVAVGPVLDEAAPVRWVREDPPFAGPVAAIAAGLAAIGDDSGWTLLLAGDLPHAEAAARRLGAALPPTADAVVFTADDQPQWLTGLYRTRALRAAVAAFDTPLENASCRALLGGLDIVWMRDDEGVSADVDTPADLERIRAELEEKP